MDRDTSSLSQAVLGAPLPWDMLYGQKVVITGATGFIGGNLVRVLDYLNRSLEAEKAVRIVLCVRDVVRARRLFSGLSKPEYIEFYYFDLNEICVPDIQDVNYVFHAASNASPKYYSVDPVGTMLPNGVGTAALLKMLQDSHDPRGFVLVSSSEVYGDLSSKESISETDVGLLDPMNIRACYAESKRFAETICISWEKQFGIPAYIVRPFHTYGPGIKDDDGRVFADFVFDAVHNRNIRMQSDGSAIRAFCFITDALKAFFYVLFRGQSSRAYNVGNPDASMSVKELATLISSLSRHKIEVFTQERDSSDQYLVSQVSKIVPNVTRLMELGWTPEVKPENGFGITIEYYNHDK